jgi:hypothetical protein
MDPTTTQETEVENVGITENEAMQQLLGKWTKEPEAKTPTEPKVESEPEQAQADAEEEAETEAEVETEAEDDGEDEIDVAGEKFKVPRKFKETAERIQAKAKEVEAGATRRFQEAADLRKAVDVENAAVKQLRQIAEKNADLLADHRMVSRRLQTLEGIDIQNTDSDTLTRLNAEYNQLQAAKTRIEQSYQQSIAKMREEEAKALKARQDHAESVVSKRIKDWGPAKQKELAEYAVGRGAPVEVINSISEPWMVEILEDAAYGRKLRDHAATLTKKVVQTAPTLKPGASGTKPKAQATADAAMARLKRTHSPQDAAMALLARSSARKR